jgi:parallel beta-helix repeat protein
MPNNILILKSMTGGSHLRWRGHRVRRGLPSITVSLMLVLALFVGLDLSFDIVPNVSSGLIEVDDSGGKDHLTIQEGVDAAQPGDTVFVYAGIYYEDVIITKTINLTGEDRDTTFINASGIGIFVQNADYVNVSGFTTINGSISGIRLMYSNNSIIENNRIEMNNYGMEIAYSNNTLVRNNIASNNSDYHGIYIYYSTNLTIEDNICSNNKNAGIWVQGDSSSNKLIYNNCSYNDYGIYLGGLSHDNIVTNNTLYYNTWYGLSDSSNGGEIYINNTIQGSWAGFYIATFLQDEKIINSSIKNSSNYDIYIEGSNTHLTAINTTFNRNKVFFGKTTNKFIVKWFLHINVKNYLGDPVSNANVNIEDNLNGSFNETFLTDINGQIKWLTIAEYTEQDPDGDNIGEKKSQTPHKIVAWNDTLVGYAQPVINESKTVIIVLYNGTLLYLKPSWNLISLPRIQLDTNLQTVLQSIKGLYDAVQWYNLTDNIDHWKHYHISKPTNLNDLNKINHTMGFWLHVIDPEGTTLVVFGDDLTSSQNISLHQGWNLVGFPSKTNKTRDIGLGTLSFGTDVDAIWTYNSTIQMWIELDDSMDYFEIGRGYWMHSRVIRDWNVPL